MILGSSQVWENWRQTRDTMGPAQLVIGQLCGAALHGILNDTVSQACAVAGAPRAAPA